jgi:hypothetical protein
MPARLKTAPGMNQRNKFHTLFDLSLKKTITPNTPHRGNTRVKLKSWQRPSPSRHLNFPLSTDEREPAVARMQVVDLQESDLEVHGQWSLQPTVPEQ